MTFKQSAHPAHQYLLFLCYRPDPIEGGGRGILSDGGHASRYVHQAITGERIPSFPGCRSEHQNFVTVHPCFTCRGATGVC